MTDLGAIGPAAPQGGASALEALIAALEVEKDESEADYSNALSEPAARSWRQAAENRAKRLEEERRTAAQTEPQAPEIGPPAPVAEQIEAAETAAEETTAAPHVEPHAEPLAAQAQAEGAAQEQTEAVAARRARRRAPPQPPRKPVPAPDIGPTPLDAEGGFDFNAYFDEVALTFESDATPEDALDGLITAADEDDIRLDPARIARVRAEACEAGCPPEIVLAAAVDLYFAVLDEA